VSVRFGNVLGSSGSVLPLFQEQIAAGGPVTITHRAMERYFMTAPEAVQLVLQAFGLGAGGEIFVLDMGQPIKILDLATRLITLCGLKVDRDIRIEFTGAGQGEKLSERLNLQSESLAPTAHSRIFQLASQEEPGQGRFQSLLKPLQEAAEAHDEAKVLRLLLEAVPEFVPAPELLKKWELSVN
jgi:FlaA1/EpsC-like NDP-sugar epimerase